jgi:cellulose synthase/poly-beta-1,6-N-acetylglucosamine synthase-like glycosyltransferase
MINIIILVEGIRRSRNKSLSVEPIHETPSVLIIIPTCGEGTTVLQRTMDAILKIDYPQDLITAVITDDCKDDDLQDLVLEYPQIHYKRRGFIKGHAKAGNVNDTLFSLENKEYKYKGQLVLILDCDMAPYPLILKTLIPCLYENKQLYYGFVQSPQHFENILGFDFLGQHYYFFYQVVLRAWNEFKLGVPCCGTNCLFQRDILMKVGGFQTGSLTEDFKTSLEFHCQGIPTRYCPEILACGFAPLTLVDFFNQRCRWALGGLQIVFSSSFYKMKNLPFTHQWIYLFSGLSPVFSIFLGCNLIVSDFNQIGNLFCQFPISSSYGNLIKVESSIDTQLSIREGIYSEIMLSLWDQSNRPLIFQDPEMTCFLIVDSIE